jgi:hypothetical protein
LKRRQTNDLTHGVLRVELIAALELADSGRQVGLLRRGSSKRGLLRSKRVAGHTKRILLLRAKLLWTKAI